jgi:fused signal recognition particle receptor
LEPVAQPIDIDTANKPHVVLLVGVNGSGKTTTAGKLAQQWRATGKSVMLAAGDTFRAAAIEQLQVWGERTGTQVIAGKQGGDAAALAYEAMATATQKGCDVLIIDTAGRLQNRSELMDELGKIVRVIKKHDEAAPHNSIIVLDGTVGQNALSQVKAFQEIAGITGLIVTKLDGSAKGGVVIALAEEFGLPVHAVGVGEGVDDLQPFDAREFANALAGVDEEAPE